MAATFVFYDTETTGHRGGVSVHDECNRIVQLSAILLSFDERGGHVQHQASSTEL